MKPYGRRNKLSGGVPGHGSGCEHCRPDAFPGRSKEKREVADLIAKTHEEIEMSQQEDKGLKVNEARATDLPADRVFARLVAMGLAPRWVHVGEDDPLEPGLEAGVVELTRWPGPIELNFGWSEGLVDISDEDDEPGEVMIDPAAVETVLNRMICENVDALDKVISRLKRDQQKWNNLKAPTRMKRPA